MRWVPKGAGSIVDGGEAEGDGSDADGDDDDDEDEDDAEDSSAGKRGVKGKKRGKGTYGRSEAHAGKNDGGGVGKGGGKSGKKGKDMGKDFNKGTGKDFSKGGKSAKGCAGRPAGKGKGEHEDAPDRKDRSERSEKSNRSEDAKRQATVQRGRYTEVRKHSSIGCAVVTMQDVNIRQALLNGGPQATIAGIRVKLKPHVDRDTQQEVMTDVFVGWGRQVEKATPLSEADLVSFFDQKHDELYSSGRLEELARRGVPPGGSPQHAQNKDDHRAQPQRQLPVASDPAVLAAVRPSPLSSMPAVVPPPPRASAGGSAPAAELAGAAAGTAGHGAGCPGAVGCPDARPVHDAVPAAAAAPAGHGIRCSYGQPRCVAGKGRQQHPQGVQAGVPQAN